MAYRIVNTVDNVADGVSAEKEKKDNGSVVGKGTNGANTNGNGSTKKMDEDEERDAVFFRLEMLGYRVGQGLVERFVLFLSYLLEGEFL